MRPHVGIVALQHSNWRSVSRMVTSLGYSPLAITNPSDLGGLTHLILPGVGAFGAVIDELNGMQLFEVIKGLIYSPIKILGLCVGMQIMGNKSEENPKSVGFSWFDMNAVKLAHKENRPEFHTGWNFCTVPNQPDFNTLFNQSFFFNHAFGFRSTTANLDFSGFTNFHGEFVSFLKSANVMGAQFHPEKSQQAGKNFLHYFICGA